MLAPRASIRAQVANLLVHVFEACAAGDYSLAQQLALVQALTALEQSQRDLTDKRWTLQHAPGREAGAAGGAGGVGGADVSPDALADALGGMGSLGGGGEAGMEAAEPEEPLEDGWERAPARRGGRRAPPRAA